MNTKSYFICQNCGAQSFKWQGRCSQCQKWNTLVEETQKQKKQQLPPSIAKPVPLDTPSSNSIQRMKTNIQELDRVLGGGLVPGGYVLLGGAPGIGKSTLLLQMSESLSSKGKVLYVCSEESTHQTRLRASRLGISSSDIFLLNESCVENILEKIKEIKPRFVIIDSIQSVYTAELNSASGTVSQVRESAYHFMNLAKSTGVCVLIIGHITKDGNLAGPRVLEHMVDTVLSFEGTSHCRILKTLKNRFGATHELGIFQMTDKGLSEIKNPSEFFLEERGKDVLGSAIFPAIEGRRPLLCEIQSLTVASFLAMPRRTSIGIELNRLHMILAVLEKNFKTQFSKYDIFLNLVGGLKVSETASDVAVAMSLLSSYHQKPLSMKTCFFGEIGLTGEIRSCPYTFERAKEAEKLGFDYIVLPSKKHLQKTRSFKIKFLEMNHIQVLKENFF